MANTFITNSIAEYIRCKDARINNAPTKSTRNKKDEIEFLYLINGKWENQKFFDQTYPMPIYQKFNDKGKNPNNKLV